MDLLVLFKVLCPDIEVDDDILDQLLLIEYNNINPEVDDEVRRKMAVYKVGHMLVITRKGEAGIQPAVSSMSYGDSTVNFSSSALTNKVGSYIYDTFSSSTYGMMYVHLLKTCTVNVMLV